MVIEVDLRCDRSTLPDGRCVIECQYPSTPTAATWANTIGLTATIVIGRLIFAIASVGRHHGVARCPDLAHRPQSIPVCTLISRRVRGHQPWVSRPITSTLVGYNPSRSSCTHRLSVSPPARRRAQRRSRR